MHLREGFLLIRFRQAFAQKREAQFHGQFLFAKLAPLGFTALDQNNCVGAWGNYAVILRRYSGSIYWILVAIRIPARSKELKKSLKTALRPNPNYTASQTWQ